MQSQQATLDLLSRFTAIDEHEQGSLQFIQEFVRKQPEYWSRRTLEGHLTASAWVTNKDHTKAVLLHHGKLDIWVQPGGHIDDEDESLVKASMREAAEETGLSSFKLVGDGIFDVDVHAIPERKGEPRHNHLDVRFWFTVEDEALSISEESNDLCWLSADEIKQKTQEESVLRMVRKSLI